MKKRIGLASAIVIAILIVCLLLWRFIPQSTSTLIPVSKDSITSFSANGMLENFELDQTDFYSIASSNPLSNEPENIMEAMEILATSKYQPDFRNLLPWGIDSVSSNNNYDGRMVTFSLYFQDEGSNYIEFQFLSNSIVVIRTADQTGMRIYHPTNSETFDKLVEYLQTHGVLQ